MVFAQQDHRPGGRQVKRAYLFLLALAGALVSFLLSFYKGKQAGRNEVNLDNARAQRDAINKANTEGREAREQNERRADDVLEKSNSGDWSGFNDRL